MSGGIVHEVKQPLSAIYGIIQLLQISGDLSEDSRQRLASALEAVERMNAILERFTTFSHMGEDTMQPVFLPDVVERIYKLLEHQLMRKAISCHIEKDPAVPFVFANLSGIQQVVSNLLINAVHALEDEKEEKQRRIDIRIGNENGFVVLKIEDNGCGMPDDVVKRMFDPFYTTKPAGKGTGLGMAIVESILLKHGAGIDVASRVGAGTRVAIRFAAAKKETP